MRKIQIGTNKEGQAILFDLEVEKVNGGDNLRTDYIYVYRLATEKEVKMFNEGYGRFVKF
jgi:hypothetical protein